MVQSNGHTSLRHPQALSGEEYAHWEGFSWLLLSSCSTTMRVNVWQNVRLVDGTMLLCWEPCDLIHTLAVAMPDGRDPMSRQ